jgi:MFS family permease
VSTTAAVQEPIRSLIPARLDRLGWSPFHTRMVCALGAAWILDGLQITIASSVTGVLASPDTLNMTSTEIGLIASVYLVGQIIGALVFGRLSDQLGRKRLLVMTSPRTPPSPWSPSSATGICTSCAWCSASTPNGRSWARRS